MNEVTEVSVNLNGEAIQIGLESFTINEDDVNGELCRAGKFLAFFANLAADMKAQAVNYKTALEAFDAEIAIEIRAESIKNGSKITEGGIKERILTHPHRKEQLIKLIKAEQDFQKIENLFRSQQKKVDCLTALAYKQRTELSTY